MAAWSEPQSPRFPRSSQQAMSPGSIFDFTVSRHRVGPDLFLIEKSMQSKIAVLRLMPTRGSNSVRRNRRRSGIGFGVISTLS